MTARLRLLTWNIWMMPEFLPLSPENMARARAIGDRLLYFDFDILCFEKAFDVHAREVLIDCLGSRYRYRYGPVNDRGVLLNGGVWVLSRYPLHDRREIAFRDATFPESLSQKGAMLLSGAVQNQPFQLLVTHLQGDDGTGYKPSHQTTRDAQMQQISRELLQPYGRAGVPLFLCGDLSTPRVEARDHRQETRPYRQMLDTFQVHNHPDFRATLDDDIRHNDLATDDTGLVQELDYILVRPGLVRVSGVWQRHVIQAPGWDRLRRHRDLSYRYAVGAEFTIG